MTRVTDKPASPTRRPRAILGVVALGLLAVGAYKVGRFAYAEYHVGRVREAVGRQDPAAARPHLDVALRERPDSGEVAFLAARAARLGGDPTAATRHLARAKLVGWSPEQIEIETLLLRAGTGEFRAVEGPLRALDRPDNPDRDLVRTVLVPNYLTEYRLHDAYAVLEGWVAAAPDHPRARLWMADVARRLELPQFATESARAAAALALDDEAARLLCGQILVEQHQAAEAKGHFEWLAARRPGDPEVMLGLARCEKELGNPDAARRVLGDLLAAHPDHPLALAERGYVEQQAGRPADALPWLRKAAEKVPGDPDVAYNLSVCLGQTGNDAEAQQWRDRHARSAADLRRMTELTKQIAKEPRNPTLRHEAGALMIRNGHRAEGVRWLQSALSIDPTHRPSRDALADEAKAAGGGK